MTSMKNTESSQSKTKDISFFEKYAIQYYTPCFQIICLWAIYLHTNEPAYMLAFIFTFSYLGKLLPKDSYPVTNSNQHNKNVFQVFPLVAHILFTWITVIKAFIDYPVQYYNSQQTFAFLVSLVFMVAPSIDASHQLIHRPQNIFKFLGFINLVIFQFTVYPIEHLYLHHKYVGTEKDPITSPKNQNVFFYSIKAFFSAHIFVFNYNKLIFCACLLSNWLYLGAMYFFAFKEFQDAQKACLKVGFFVLLGFGGFLFLQLIEYIEHYGLVYRQDVDKKQINQISSWNSEENILNNWLIFRFQRHSDHHMNAYKIFTTLELTDKMPRFPFNFLEGAIISCFPPLWYFIMNPYVDQVLEKKPIEKSHRQLVKFVKQGVSLLILIHTWYRTYLVYQNGSYNQ